MTKPLRFLLAAVIAAVVCVPADPWQLLANNEDSGVLDRPMLDDVQRLFYTARYDDAAALALTVRSSHPEELAAYEIRTAALHFQLKEALGDERDKDKAFQQCPSCAGLLKAFLSETERGQAIARERLRADPRDDTALFFLGKLDLNYVWLQLSTLGHKTGWSEYWEARKSLDTVLKRNPKNVRARVARAWIDYIVDTKMARGTRWLLGGGSKKRALIAMHEAAATEADFFVHTEAEFGLWDMLVRERQLVEATVVARRLAADFPDNRDLAAFLKAHDPAEGP